MRCCTKTFVLVLYLLRASPDERPDVRGNFVAEQGFAITDLDGYLVRSDGPDAAVSVDQGLPLSAAIPAADLAINFPGECGILEPSEHLSTSLWSGEALLVAHK